MSRTSPFTRAASAALARPGPIAAATSAGVEPRGTSRTEPSGRLILSISVIEKSCPLRELRNGTGPRRPKGLPVGNREGARHPARLRARRCASAAAAVDRGEAGVEVVGQASAVERVAVAAQRHPAREDDNPAVEVVDPGGPAGRLVAAIDGDTPGRVDALD